MTRLFACAALRGCAVLLALGVAAPCIAQSRYATHVVSFAPGPNGNPNFANPNRFLRGPQGGGFSNGSLDVVTLGTGGELTVGFDVTIVDGPGADLIVSENGFFFDDGVFAEITFVEISTDGVNFARFPTRYAGPPGPLPKFGTSPMGTFGGLCGGLPGLANVVTNAIDPFDPVVAGGEAFDLADLADHPLVLSGVVVLDDIHYLRVIDVEEGIHFDSFGNVIWDHGGVDGSADVDAVSVIHHAGNVTGHEPLVDFRIDAQGYLWLDIADPDGFGDLDLSSLTASVDLRPARFGDIRRLLKVVGQSPEGVQLRSTAPVVGSGLKRVFAVSIRDQAGDRSGDQVHLPG